MCLSCGCHMPDDNMGSEDTIVTEDVARAAIAMGQDGKSVIADLIDALQNDITPEDVDKKIEELKKAA